MIPAGRAWIGLAVFLVRLGEKEMVRRVLCEVVQRTRRDFLKIIYGGDQNEKGASSQPAVHQPQRTSGLPQCLTGPFGYVPVPPARAESIVAGCPDRWRAPAQGTPTGDAKKMKNLIFTLELSQKSDFQHSTTKSDNIGHPTVKTGQIWPLRWFWRWFCIS